MVRSKAIRGALSVAIEAKRKGFKGVILPVENASEAAIVKGGDILPVDTLADVVMFLNGEKEIEAAQINIEDIFRSHAVSLVDFADVRGQEHAKRALEVGAAGGHNILIA